MFKFGRAYNLQIGTNDGSLLPVALPFTMEFDIKRDKYASSNNFSIRVYNLGIKSRDQIRYDIFRYGGYRPIVLQAGYGNQLAVIITGNITECWSVREGNNMITEIQGFDAGYDFINGTTETPYISGTPNQSIIGNMASSFTYSTVGAIGSFPGAINKGKSYSGNTANLLNEITGGGFFIDCGTVNCLNNNEALDLDPYLINYQTGLLDTPVLEEVTLNLSILFEPRIKIGQLVELQSLTNKLYNGIYKINGIHHKGVISGAVNGDCRTELSLFGGQTFNQVPVFQP